MPLVGPGAQQPGLGGDDEIRGIRLQRLADEFLGDERAVGVRGVDEVDAELDRATQHADAFVAIGRRTPNALAGQSHCAEPEPIHGQIAAEGKGA